MTKQFLYITGDSFCFERSDPQNHWPLRLANLLELKLQGAGYPGQGWWPSRKHFFKYKDTAKFNKTKIFIFCHTNICRPLTDNKLLPANIQDVYNKYILDYQFSVWSAQNWYKEINQCLDNRFVIHLHCFENNKYIRSSLNGLQVQPELLTLARINTNNDRALMHQLPNHFNNHGNCLLADCLYDRIVNGVDTIDSLRFQTSNYK